MKFKQGLELLFGKLKSKLSQCYRLVKAWIKVFKKHLKASLEFNQYYYYYH